MYRRCGHDRQGHRVGLYGPVIPCVFHHQAVTIEITHGHHENIVVTVQPALQDLVVSRSQIVIDLAEEDPVRAAVEHILIIPVTVDVSGGDLHIEPVEPDIIVLVLDGDHLLELGMGIIQDGTRDHGPGVSHDDNLVQAIAVEISGGHIGVADDGLVELIHQGRVTIERVIEDPVMQPPVRTMGGYDHLGSIIAIQVTGGDGGLPPAILHYGEGVAKFHALVGRGLASLVVPAPHPRDQSVLEITHCDELLPAIAIHISGGHIMLGRGVERFVPGSG